MNEKRLNKINKYYAMIIALFSAAVVIMSCIFRYIEYLKSEFYFDYYGLNQHLYKYGDQGFMFYLCTGLIFILPIFSSILLFKENLKAEKIMSAKGIFNLIVLAIYNFFLVNIGFRIFLVNIGFDISSRCIQHITIASVTITEASLVAIKPKVTLKQAVYFIIKYIFVIVFAYIAILYLVTSSELKNNKIYNIIENNKAVVYTTNDYYIALDCKIDEKNNKLILYKGKQTKILTNDITTEQRIFKKVVLKK